ncbi:hypothetical protein CRE_23318 [Caenorhabditis remanei]|uniref:Uncharacterized protein n=1 Tax=Caenorhabditis remanei TaxID=31234 RepID=E3MGT4_CAERE|nr:hypothetical protein CRE_23318 [Caenorhabditis remanei]
MCKFSDFFKDSSLSFNLPIPKKIVCEIERLTMREKGDFGGLISLRQVSRDIRSIIDSNPLFYENASIKIQGNETIVTFDSTSEVFPHASKTVFEENLTKIFHDLKRLSCHPRLLINYFIVSNGQQLPYYFPENMNRVFSKFYKEFSRLKRHLSASNSFLPVEKVRIESNTMLRNVFLNLFQPGKLEKIDLDGFAWSHDTMELEQFRQAKEFKFTGWTDLYTRNKVNHFSIFDMKAKVLSVKEMIELKNDAFESETIQKWRLYWIENYWDDRKFNELENNLAPCLPTSKSTFLFAYSNDVEPGIVEHAAKRINEVADQFLKSPNKRFRVLASVRFDVNKKNEQIYYNTSGPGFYDSVLNNLPDPKLSFPSPRTGSDVLEVIEKLLDNAVSPVCGSVIFILAKRYPDKSDTSLLLTRLRDQHVSLQTFISSDATGGSDKQILYDLSVKTNGFCGFAENLTDADVTTIFMTNYLFYAVNPTVAGVGTVELPAALLDEPDLHNQGVWVFMEINVQSHPLDDSFKSVQILMYDQKINHTEVITFERGTRKLKKPFHTFDLVDWPTIRLGREQRMTLNYNYNNSKEQNLQIRMYHGYDDLPWYPYSN